jgi:hypothetical protein
VTEYSSDEIQHLRNIQAALREPWIKKEKKKDDNRKKKLIGITSLLFQQSTSYMISRLLRKFNTKTVIIPAKKSSHIQRLAKV